jgi:tRNA pseudouridine38-40 synthase
MPRYALKIEYDGTPFVGWQRQAGQPTVQGAVEAALARLQRDVPTIAAAGRTDTGVHALGQVAHCDMGRNWDPFRLSEALNYHLKPLPIAVVDCAAVPGDWHARFSALERHYVFRMIARRAPLTHDVYRAWRVRQPLDIGAMRAGAAHLVGHHDFTTFRATHCQADSPMKTLDEITLTEIPIEHGQEIRVFLRARSFLHNQVRSIVGTLEHVGAGTWQPEDVKAALAARDRAACGTVCPPHGLYLAHARYPEPVFRGEM